MKPKVSKPAGAVAVSLPSPPPLKRGRGRPRKNPMAEHDMPSVYAASSKKDEVNPKTMQKGMDAKALTVFRRAIADAEQANMTPAEDFDGGGTPETAHTVTKDSLLRRVTRRLNVLDRFLTDDKLVELLAFSSLKEIGIYEGILLDKSMVLQGQPTMIIGSDQRQELKDALPRLMDELKRRGLINQSAQPRVVNP